MQFSSIFVLFLHILLRKQLIFTRFENSGRGPGDPKFCFFDMYDVQGLLYLGPCLLLGLLGLLCEAGEAQKQTRPGGARGSVFVAMSLLRVAELPLRTAFI